jgi:hypothetical protein
MINLFKAFFIVKKVKENEIAANIEITEMPANAWWG